MKFVREFNQFMFKRTFSLFDYFAMVIFGYLASTVSLWFALAVFPIVVIKIYMENLVKEYND